MMYTKQYIEKKNLELDNAGEKLKELYVGLDGVIDNIINSIRSWYVFDDILYSPTILNLWSLTGHGKTTLIKNLFNILGMGNSVVKVDVFKNVGSYMTNGSQSSLEETILGKFSSANTKGVVILDEFHNISKTSNGRLSDVWGVLSDGNIDTSEYYITRLETFISEVNDVIKGQHRRMIENLDNGIAPRLEPFYMYEHVLNMIVRVIESSNLDPFEILSPIFQFINANYNSINQAYNIKPGIEIMFKSLYIGGSITVKDILRHPGLIYPQPIIEVAKNVIDKISSASNILTNSGKKNPYIFSKLLFVVIGNMDQFILDDQDFHKDIDDLRSLTLSIKSSDMKNHLRKFLAHEQLSRLGDNYVIFPSLRRDDFELIIVNNLRIIENNVFELSNINLNLSINKKLISYILDNTIPSQGVRPVISKINGMISAILPKIMVDYIVNEDTNVDIMKYITK